MELYQKRDFSTIISDTFTFIKNNYKILLKSVALYSLPFFLIGSVIQSYNIKYQMEYEYVWSNLTASIIAILFQVIASSTAIICILGFMKLYNTRTADNEITTDDLFREIKAWLLPVIGLSFILTLVLGVAFAALIIPGIYFAVALSLAVPVFMNEDSGMWNSLRKSKKLTSGKWWPTLGVLIVMLTIVYMVTVIFSLPQQAYVMSSVFFWSDEMTIPILPLIMLGIFSSIGSAFASIILYVAVGIIYYSYREELEGVKLMQKVNQFGEANTSNALDI